LAIVNGIDHAHGDDHVPERGYDQGIDHDQGDRSRK